MPSVESEPKNKLGGAGQAESMQICDPLTLS